MVEFCQFVGFKPTGAQHATVFYHIKYDIQYHHYSTHSKPIEEYILRMLTGMKSSCYVGLLDLCLSTGCSVGAVLVLDEEPGEFIMTPFRCKMQGS